MADIILYIQNGEKTFDSLLSISKIRNLNFNCNVRQAACTGNDANNNSLKVENYKQTACLTSLNCKNFFRTRAAQKHQCYIQHASNNKKQPLISKSNEISIIKYICVYDHIRNYVNEHPGNIEASKETTEK
ncbi:hypothetical protein HELRODRAFT_159229 [Helobdella robusta]|uniref:Uncharacterized protein n=1 Tax=Helobdella robusta TaxID=6412 RepID=T1ENR9_HELRO|nr:hypothetical protein HELRODRAFT_159229 [Helobdella robusta]ESO12653.1 hypothetical protein HELRODRAFT_159229 [Helobdella robusta]